MYWDIYVVLREMIMKNRECMKKMIFSPLETAKAV
jgi:hypothetical protein